MSTRSLKTTTEPTKLDDSKDIILEEKNAIDMKKISTLSKLNIRY